MSISGISSSLLSASTMSLTSASGSGAAQGFDAQLESLIDDIQTGDLDAAQQVYDQISQQGNGSGDGQDPIGQLLSQVGSALQSGDVSSAQSAVASFLQAAPPSGGTGGPPPGADPQAVKTDLLSLLDAVQSGNLDSAKSAYSALESLLSGDSSSTATTSDRSTSTTATSNSQDPFSQLLSSLASALNSNDLGSAQQAIQSFFQNAPDGSLVDITA